MLAASDKGKLRLPLSGRTINHMRDEAHIYQWISTLAIHRRFQSSSLIQSQEKSVEENQKTSLKVKANFKYIIDINNIDDKEKQIGEWYGIEIMYHETVVAGGQCGPYQ